MLGAFWVTAGRLLCEEGPIICAQHLGARNSRRDKTMLLRLSVAFRGWVARAKRAVRTGAAVPCGTRSSRHGQVKPSRARAGSAHDVTGTSGAVYVEFLIAFLPVLTMFLGLMQLAFLFAVRIAVEHAAVNAARTAAVVIGDDDKLYPNEARDQVKKGGKRYAAIRRSAILTLAPFVLDNTLSLIEISFPPNNLPGGDPKDDGTYKPITGNDTIDKVRVRVEVRAACKIMIANRIACGQWWENAATLGQPAKMVRAEAMFPYQGARYEYP
jgi:hypothetical protein